MFTNLRFAQIGVVSFLVMMSLGSATRRFSNLAHACLALGTRRKHLFKGNFLYLSKFSTLRIITFCSTANSCELKHYSDLVLKILRHEKSPQYILPSLTTSLIVICHISKVRALLVEPEIR